MEKEEKKPFVIIACLRHRERFFPAGPNFPAPHKIPTGVLVSSSQILNLQGADLN